MPAWELLAPPVPRVFRRLSAPLRAIRTFAFRTADSPAPKAPREPCPGRKGAVLAGWGRVDLLGAPKEDPGSGDVLVSPPRSVAPMGVREGGGRDEQRPG